MLPFLNVYKTVLVTLVWILSLSVIINVPQGIQLVRKRKGKLNLFLFAKCLLFLKLYLLNIVNTFLGLGG